MDWLSWEGIMKKEGLGVDGENLAAEYLISHGYKMIARNFISRFGEIDIIAKQGNYLCFIEVKTRKSRRNIASGYEAVSPAKQRKIISTANYFLITNRHYLNLQPRFDCIEVNIDEKTGKVNIDMLKAAFE